MPTHTRPLPLYHHKPSNRARTRIDGRDVYLGEWGSPEAIAQLARLEAERARASLRPHARLVYHLVELYVLDRDLVAGAKLKPDDSLRRSMVREVLRLEHLAGKPITELCAGDLETLLHHLAELTVEKKVGEGVDARVVMVPRYSRGVCNKMGRFFRQMIRWCERKGHAPPGTWHKLAAAESLRYGETNARETEKVQPVSDDVIAATLKQLSPVVADMVRFQRLVGCRPDETCRLCLADTSERIVETDAGPVNVLIWKLKKHKTQWRAHERIIAVGPKAQMIIARNTTTSLSAPVFRTTEGEQYRRDSYTRAVARAAKRAGVEHWTPNRLRHARATEVDELAGLETASAVLGHANLNTTGVYIQRRTKAAMRAAALSG